MKYKQLNVLILWLFATVFINNMTTAQEVDFTILNSLQEWQSAQDKAKKTGRDIFLDIYASWCGPCKMIAPILEDLAKEFEGKLHVYKVDTEAEGDLAGAFGIQSIPSLLFVPMEGQPQMAMGALPKAQLKNAIKDVLGVE